MSSESTTSAGARTSSWVSSGAKRGADIAGALILLVLSVPFLVVALLLSAVAFRAVPVFVQERSGRHGERFKMLKVRSLPAAFPASMGKRDLDESSLSRASKLLRFSHIDELLQLVNVVAGSMSLVGPRPMIDEVLQTISPADRAARASVRPGMTGAWQVSSLGARPLAECTELDAAYASSASVRDDAWLMWRTAVSLVGAAPVDPAVMIERRRWATAEAELSELRVA